MFNASIINLETGVQEQGRSVNYETLGDGITVMRELVDELMGLSEPEQIRREAEQASPAAPERSQAPKSFSPNSRFWSIGGTAGSSFAAPWFIGTVQGTLAFLPHILVEIGCDVGFIHGYDESDVGYVSVYPFGHLNGFVPFGAYGGWYGGLGGGAMLAFYTVNDTTTPFTTPAFDISTGLYLGKNHHYFTLSFTVRTNFDVMNSKLAAGYSYRFE
jgi:hypothetical protein